MSGIVESGTDFWPSEMLPEHLQAADEFIETYAASYDWCFGIGDILRDVWKLVRPKPSCDCPMDPHHRWNCALTPIWAQTMRDLDTNPWTVIPNTVHRFGLDLTPESFERLKKSLDAVTEAERKAWVQSTGLIADCAPAGCQCPCHSPGMSVAHVVACCTEPTR